MIYLVTRVRTVHQAVYCVHQPTKHKIIVIFEFSVSYFGESPDDDVLLGSR